MHRIIDETGNRYSLYSYPKEDEFEKMIVANVDTIFGKNGIYFNIKKLIGTPKKGATIPDGYYLDLNFHKDPILYLVEVELSNHDLYAHIGEQLLRFGIASVEDKYKIKQILSSVIQKDDDMQLKISNYLKQSSFSSNSDLLDRVIFDNKPSSIVIIDEVTDDLHKVMGQLTMGIEVLEVQTYICDDDNAKKLHLFTPLHDDILTDVQENEDVDELDTIVVPAREAGFREEFLKNNQWFAVRISSALIDKIKYIAAYQVAPISGITHIAEVNRIEKYNNTDKYIIYFKTGTTTEINKVELGEKKGLAPQAPRYTSYKTVINAKSLDDLWKK